MMFNFLFGGFIKIIEPQRVLIVFNFPQETIFELHPFGAANLTFKHAFLDPHAVILARTRNAAQPAKSGFLDGGNIIGDED